MCKAKSQVWRKGPARFPSFVDQIEMNGEKAEKERRNAERSNDTRLQ